ncbi:uncharacterized protein [Ptychodera flava]|uniref:uncharacterized protein n=1 Tax=Ptychodera flava TaxID=63121 RepID=UPI00396A7F5B
MKESDGKRKENNETKCDKQKTMKKRKSSDMHKSSDTAEREKHSKVVGKQKTDQRTSKDHGGAEPSSPSNARKLKDSESVSQSSERNGINSEDDFHFEEVRFLSTDGVWDKLKEGQMLLCRPFKQKDYNPEDPFIFRLLSKSAKNKRFQGLLMCGELEGNYKDGDQVWARSQCHVEVRVDRVMAIISWEMGSSMPVGLANKIRKYTKTLLA